MEFLYDFLHSTSKAYSKSTTNRSNGVWAIRSTCLPRYKVLTWHGQTVTLGDTRANTGQHDSPSYPAVFSRLWEVYTDYSCSLPVFTGRKHGQCILSTRADDPCRQNTAVLFLPTRSVYTRVLSRHYPSLRTVFIVSKITSVITCRVHV